MLTISFRRPVFPACFEAIKSSSRSHKAFGSLGRKTPRPFFSFCSRINFNFLLLGAFNFFHPRTSTAYNAFVFSSISQYLSLSSSVAKLGSGFFMVIKPQRHWVPRYLLSPIIKSFPSIPTSASPSKNCPSLSFNPKVWSVIGSVLWTFEMVKTSVQFGVKPFSKSPFFLWSKITHPQSWKLQAKLTGEKLKGWSNSREKTNSRLSLE